MAGLPGSSFPEAIEFERRLAELENQIASRAPSNSEIDPSTAIMIGQGVPRVNGLVVTAATLKNVLTWNSVPITDLKRYEIQWSLTTSFDAIIDTKFTRETSWTHDNPTAESLHYYRVRARNTVEATGAWSAVTSNTPGQNGTDNLGTGIITTPKVADGAITTAKLATEVLFAVDGESEATFGFTHTDFQNKASATVNITSDTTAVIIWCMFSVSIDTASRELDWRVLRETTVLADLTEKPQHTDIPYAVVANWFDTSFTAGSGSTTYNLDMRAQAASGTITIDNKFFVVMAMKSNT